MKFLLMYAKLTTGSGNTVQAVDDGSATIAMAPLGDKGRDVSYTLHPRSLNRWQPEGKYSCGNRALS